MKHRFALAILFATAACDRNHASQGSADTAGSSAPPPAVTVAEPVTEFGIGPLRAGMTVAEARRALGTLETRAGTDTSACDYASSRSLPAGVDVMLVNGRVARIDVDTNTVPTADGARVGDSEKRVLGLYGKRVAVSPHKYTDGHYLTVKSATGDTSHLIIFETNRDTVTLYRAGLVPHVQYVERCG